MTRLSNSSMDKKKVLAQGGKGRHPAARQSEHAGAGSHRKHSLDAYYRPRHRGFIDACLREADDIDADLTADA